MTYPVILLALIFTQCSFCAEKNSSKLENGARVQVIEDFKIFGLNPNSINPSVIADAFLTTPELLRKYGYPSEIHKVQTADGYVLEMHRIPNADGVPVYLQHGVMDSSGGWVLMGPRISFAYLLADLGYDVWMGNCRGNRYSRQHIFLSTESRKFWDFSFHEIGIYDVPAMIDYVLQVTGYKKLHYIGHSQGTTVFWVMCSQTEGYAEKIISMQALAPIAYLKNAKSPVVRAIAPFSNQLDLISTILGINEFLPNNNFLKIVGQAVCRRDFATQPLCYNSIFLVTGFDIEQLNRTMLPVILGHIPAGISTKQLIHYGQLCNSGDFAEFDDRLLNPLGLLGSRPPSYDLKKVTAPVALHCGENDWLSDLADVSRLEQGLPNIVEKYLVPNRKFNHLDFLFAIDVRKLVYSKVIGVMKRLENRLMNIN